MQFGPKVSRSRSDLYVQTIGWIGCVLVAISIGRMIGAPPDLRWIALALLTVASAQLTLRMPSVPVTFSVSDIFTFTAALMFGPGPGAVTAAIDAAVLSSRLVQTPRSANRILFNVSAAAIAMAVSARLFFLLRGAVRGGAVGYHRPPDWPGGFRPHLLCPEHGIRRDRHRACGSKRSVGGVA